MFVELFVVLFYFVEGGEKGITYGEESEIERKV